jgi:hypothetical protein
MVLGAMLVEGSVADRLELAGESSCRLNNIQTCTGKSGAKISLKEDLEQH